MNALIWITKEAKHIRKIHGGTWKAAVKKAGAKYRAGKIHGTKKRSVGSTRPKKTARKKTVRRIKKLHTLEGKAIHALRGVRSTFQAAAIGGLTTAQHLASIKDKILGDMMFFQVQKIKATTKADKNKAQKKYAAKLKEYKKILAIQGKK